MRVASQRLVRRDRVLAREDEGLALSDLRAEVSRASVAELGCGDLVNTCAASASRIGAAVARAGIHDDDLDLLRDDLAPDCVETADEVGSAVQDRDDDRDHAGIAATTNWYAKSGGRRLPTACAMRSVVGVRATGSGTVKSRSAMR